MKISVVIPIYNMEHYLNRCIKSLLAQTYSDWESILVDDGSTDSSGQMCDSYALQDSRIRTVHRENGGLGVARNTGLEMSAGEYVLFLDPDDYFGPELMQNLANAAKRTKADLIIGGHTVVDSNGNKHPHGNTYERVFNTTGEMEALLLNTIGTPPEEPLDSQYGVSACGRLYRHEIIQNNELRFVSERILISEDLIFNIEFLRQAQCAAVINDASYFYCTNEGSLSKKHREDRFEKDCVLCQAVGDRLNEWYPEDKYRMSLARLLISRARYDIAQEVNYHDMVDRTYPLREKVKNIVCSAELCEALNGYPWHKLPWMQGIFAWFMKQKQVWALMFLVRLRRRFLKHL